MSKCFGMSLRLIELNVWFIAAFNKKAYGKSKIFYSISKEKNLKKI